MPTSTDLVTDLPADFEVFGQAVDTSMADLKGGTTGQILSKATNADMDFTWITNDIGDITAVNVTAPITGGGSSGAVTIGVSAASTAAAGVVQLSDSTSTTSSVLASTPTATKSAYDLANTANTAAGTAQTTANAAIPKSTVTTAGDVIYATGSGAVTRLGIGTANQVLRVNSGATAPEWATPASGGGMTVISTGTLSSTGVTFSSIAGTYNNLELHITGYNLAGGGRLFVRVNGDSGTNYTGGYTRFRDGVALSSAGAVSPGQTAQIETDGGTTPDNGTTNSAILTFPAYATTTGAKLVSALAYDLATYKIPSFNFYAYHGTAGAITSITIVASASTFSAGTYTLYGVK
jgi:hypothetical protein